MSQKHVCWHTGLICTFNNILLNNAGEAQDRYSVWQDNTGAMCKQIGYTRALPELVQEVRLTPPLLN